MSRRCMEISLDSDECVVNDLQRLLEHLPRERVPEIHAVVTVMKALDRLPIGGQDAVVEVLRAFRVLDPRAQDRLLAVLSDLELQ